MSLRSHREVGHVMARDADVDLRGREITDDALLSSKEAMTRLCITPSNSTRMFLPLTLACLGAAAEAPKIREQGEVDQSSTYWAHISVFGGKFLLDHMLLWNPCQ